MRQKIEREREREREEGKDREGGTERRLTGGNSI